MQKALKARLRKFGNALATEFLLFVDEFINLFGT
jgi:hypothetical protein